MRAVVGLILALAATTAAWSAEPAPPAPLDYARPEHWVCRPDIDGACASDLTTTVITADGSLRREAFVRAKRPEVDCFYLYPTVSHGPDAGAPATVTEDERRAVRQQLERLASVCRLYAPVYRQVTVTAMKAGVSSRTIPGLEAAGRTSRADAMAAWRYYVANENYGRGVILIGHSQGAALLTELIQQEIDGRPGRKQMVSAILAGGWVTAPEGADRGGTFRTIPACRQNGQIGCVLTFNTYRAERPVPEAKAMPFDKARTPLCTNPAALSGGSGALKPILSATGETIIPELTAPQPPWTDPPSRIDTPFVALPGLFEAECRHDKHGVYLAVWSVAGPGDGRTGALTGEWMIDGVADDTMGLHNIDLNLTAGNLLEVVRAQIAAYARKP